MNRPSLNMLHVQDAHDSFHTAIQRIKQRETIADKPISLGTHYSANESPAEPTETTNWYTDEISDHVKTRTVFSAIICLVIGAVTVCAFVGLVAWMCGK